MTPRTSRPPAFALILFLAYAGHVQAQDQDLEALRQQTAVWLKAKAEQSYADTHATVSLGPVDQRLRFESCQRLEFAFPSDGHPWGRGSVEARCLEPRAWRLYLTYDIRLNGPALVTRQPLAAHELLDPGKVTLSRLDYTRAPDTYLQTLPSSAQVNRALPTGQPLNLEQLVLPKLIQAGRTVQILVSGQGFSLSQQGVALASASAGQMVKLKTPSGRIVQGRVNSTGQVEIQP